MPAWNESFLWASLIWGSVGAGYCIYGWKQRAAIPFITGAVMSAISFFVPALPMTLISLALMAGTYWLTKQGY